DPSRQFQPPSGCPATPHEPGRPAGGRRSCVVLDSVGGDGDAAGAFGLVDLEHRPPNVASEEHRQLVATDTLLADVQAGGLEGRTLEGRRLAADSGLRLLDFRIDGTLHAAGSRVELAQGSLILHADGRYEFVPNADWNGVLPDIRFRVDDA